MKIKSAVFEVSAPDLKSCPRWAMPQFAFIGRSNVGKSPLINLLSERKELAKVSVTPGKTKLINFFIMNGNWSLVDLPGYGYANVGKLQRNQFNEAVGDYLEQRKNIFCTFVLIDSRLPPQAIDLEFLRWLASCGVKFALIFTKMDKLSVSQAEANIAVFKKQMAETCGPVPATFNSSAKTKRGRTEILNFIEEQLVKNNRA